MNTLKLARIFILIGVILALTSSARATYEEQLAERDQLKAALADSKSALAVAHKYQMVGLEKGNAALIEKAQQLIKVSEKNIKRYEHKLQGVQAKIVKSENDRMKARMQETARELAQKASRDAAIAAAQAAAKNTARDIAKNASKDSAKTASKDSNKGSSQDAAKSAAHPPPPPVCKPSH